MISVKSSFLFTTSSILAISSSINIFDNYIETAMRSILKNPILEVLSEIRITKILKQSNFIKREVGYPPFQIILHFIYMLIMNKRQSTFIKNSE